MGIYTRQDPRDRKIQEQQLAALLEQNRLLAGVLAAVDHIARQTPSPVLVPLDQAESKEA